MNTSFKKLLNDMAVSTVESGCGTAHVILNYTMDVFKFSIHGVESIEAHLMSRLTGHDIEITVLNRRKGTFAFRKKVKTVYADVIYSIKHNPLIGATPNSEEDVAVESLNHGDVK